MNIGRNNELAFSTALVSHREIYRMVHPIMTNYIVILKTGNSLRWDTSREIHVSVFSFDGLYVNSSSFLHTFIIVSIERLFRMLMNALNFIISLLGIVKRF